MYIGINGRKTAICVSMWCLSCGVVINILKTAALTPMLFYKLVVTCKIVMKKPVNK